MKVSIILRSLVLSSAFAFSAGAQEAFLATCAASDYVVLQGPAVHIAVSGTTYTPKCSRIKRGTKVTIDAAPQHPLQGIQAAGIVNPIFDELGGAVAPKTVTFAQPGAFGFYCVAHGDDTGAGMAGSIIVE